MADPIRVVIVEDVALARAALLRLLSAHGDIAVVGVAASHAEALALRDAVPVDLALLDVRLPDGTGVDLAANWPEPCPAFVFITAEPDHAVDAFALEAADYLLKPITAEGLARALDRVRKRRAGIAPAGTAAAGIEIRDGGRTLWLARELIDYVDVAGHYLCLHVGRDVHLLRQPIGDLAAELGAEFLRVHRSAIVRLDRVRAVTARRNGDADIALDGGVTVPLSRNYREPFDAAMRGRNRG